MRQTIYNKIANSLGSTAYGSAQLRAMENLLPEDKRLFEDPYSEKFLPPF